MSMKTVTKYEFVCDSCRSVINRDENHLPRAWKTVHGRDGRELMVCGSCAAQIDRTLTLLGEHFVRMEGHIYVGVRHGGAKCKG